MPLPSNANGDGCKANGYNGANANGSHSVAHLHASRAFSSGQFQILGDCEILDIFLQKIKRFN